MNEDKLKLINQLYTLFGDELFSLSAQRFGDKINYAVTYGDYFKQCMENIEVNKLSTPKLYSEDLMHVQCEAVENATSYQVRTLTNLTDFNYYDVSTIDDALQYTYVENSFYTIKAIGDNVNYLDSDFSNDIYRPGNPEVSYEKLSEITYNVIVNRNATGMKTKLVIKDLSDINADKIYEGSEQNYQAEFLFYEAGTYEITVQEVPIDENDKEIIALKSDIITLTINVEEV